MRNTELQWWHWCVGALFLLVFIGGIWGVVSSQTPPAPPTMLPGRDARAEPDAPVTTPKAP